MYCAALTTFITDVVMIIWYQIIVQFSLRNSTRIYLDKHYNAVQDSQRLSYLSLVLFHYAVCETSI